MRLLLVGIGAGHPDQVTAEAIRAMNTVDVFLVAAKDRGVDDLVTIREEICRRHLTRTPRIIEVPDPDRDRRPADYTRAVQDWHEARAARYERVLAEQVRPDETAGFLVWGDPGLYDSTIRVVERVLARGRVTFAWEVIPGVSSVQVLAARHRLVLNRIGGPVTITTGRQLRDVVDAGGDNVVVMLDGDLACRDLPGDWDIWWGANLGTADEALVAGRLTDVMEAIETARADARSGRGWVMDTYLLRRR